MAGAESLVIKPYVGVDYAKLYVDYTTENGIDNEDVLGNFFNGVSPYAGLQVTEHFGIEAGYTHTDNQSQNLNTIGVVGFSPSAPLKTEIRLELFHVEAIGRLPLNDKLHLIGSAGVVFGKGVARVKNTATGKSIRASVNDTAFRGAGGVEFHFDEHFYVRGTVRYSTLKFKGTTSGVLLSQIGMGFNF